jgi:hypothetical protein
MAESTESLSNAQDEVRWPKPVVLGSLAVIGVSLVLAILYPRARAAIGAAVIISPIPPIP